MAKAKFLKTITLRPGKKVSIATPEGKRLDPQTIWIEGFFEPSKKSGEGLMVIFRIWLKRQRRWEFYINSLNILQLWNDHIYKIRIYEANKKKTIKKRRDNKNTTTKSVQRGKSKISKTLDPKDPKQCNTSKNGIEGKNNPEGKQK